ncbi:glycosyltransferase 25 family member-like isoform X2 [Agrilus planipennis]|uniref:Glycosyltransferase 25 family member-like isoform X1 n=1 Tax=Agrilus planipennis TaxID=224129 RepID=A0A7F5RGP7_AGRPL|nr:glycosyltransferase 25 family member-like isoform X1 [Agrilus planipennis]XP_025835148.1 glycosyltransferase 25 family member-like isoform X2 [Agrilus planipennis]
MINLLRRPERRKRMMRCFDELGLEVEILDAVDGRHLSDDVLEEIKFLPGYADPYHKRPMTLGEIGCFLSHYNIWEEAYEKGYEKVMVLEDDIRFEAYFRSRMERLMEEVEDIPGWDLIYLGRKRMEHADEPWVSDSLVRAAYSYWTLGYVISKSGIKKLLEADPLSKLLPVDEFLPIMFDRHPEESWKNHFPKRDLLALSAAPLLVYPMRYTGEEGYISDTEDSKVVSLELENSIKADEFR